MSRQLALWVCLHCFWLLHRAESNSFVEYPSVVRGDVTKSAALEWTLESEPGKDDSVGFKVNGADVFRYIPYSGAIPPPVVDGAGGNGNATYDPRFSIYNTTTRGVGFRLTGLRPEDAGTYKCTYDSLSTQITKDTVLFVYDIPATPTIEQTPEDNIDGPTNVTLTCNATSTSLPVAHRPAMMYTWSRNGVDIDRTGPPERHAVLGDSGQILEISPVHHTDTTYTCTAAENGTQLTSEETEVTLGMDVQQQYTLTLASAAAGGLVLLIIIIVVAVCCARRRRKEDDIIPYGSVTANGTRTFANRAPHSDPEEMVYHEIDQEHRKPAVNQDSKALLPAIYALANKTEGKTDKKVKETKRGPEPELYAEVDKNRPREEKDKAKEKWKNKVPNALTGSISLDYEDVNKTEGKTDKKVKETKRGPEPELYAEVDNNRLREEKEKAQEKWKNDVPNGLTAPVPLHYEEVEAASAPIPDHVTSGADDPYTDIASVCKKDEQGQGQSPKVPQKIQGFNDKELTSSATADMNGI